MQTNGVIGRKLALLDDQVQKLTARLAGVSRTNFKEDWVLRSMAERALQVAAEIMIDIAERIIAVRGAGPVAGATEAISKLVSLGILKDGKNYVDIVRFRNLIVYEYEKIDPDILYDLATGRLEEFRAFRDELDRTL